MNFWHMQLAPTESKFTYEKIKKILETKKVIGMGDEWIEKSGNNSSAPIKFKQKMHIGDIVMIRTGANPVALVEIISDAKLEDNTDDKLDWFPLQREIKILDFYTEYQEQLLTNILNKYNNEYLVAQGTLVYCTDNNCATNQFIKEWYQQYSRENLMNNIKISDKEQQNLKSLWNNFKELNKDKYTEEKINELLNDWRKYENKIKDNSLQLEQYTNILEKRDSDSLPGGYLCNFLERTTRNILGSSKPGTANNFGVKLNDDGLSYYIQKSNENASVEEATSYFKNNILPLLNKLTTLEISSQIKLIDEIIQNKNNNYHYSANQILMKMAVIMDLAKGSSHFIQIYSDNTISTLYKEFIQGYSENIFEQNYQITTVMKHILDIENNAVDICLLSEFLWQYANVKTIVDKNSPNVILYGPPGTGKTYEIKQYLKFICKGDHSRHEYVQFHPSFTYEDFIEGIKPKGIDENGNLKFELVNGIFKKFCIKAKNNPNQNYYFVVDEINRANLSAVFGETLSLLEKDYRHDVNSQNSDNTLIKTQYSSLIEDLINETKENCQNYTDLAYMYDHHHKSVKFGIPQNIFFIGMMNDVDKSIDAFDLALRRRFKWIRKDCDYDVIKNNTFLNQDKNYEFLNIDQYIKCCKDLNEHISKTLGLGKSYEFGHSFFMKMSDIARKITISEKDLENLFNLYLSPTLKEYLRTIYPENELDNAIENALIKFKSKI